MPTQNLYDSITLAENIKIQAKARNVQLKDMFAELDLSKGTLSNLRLGKKSPPTVWRVLPTILTALWTSSWGALLTPP